MDGIGAAALAGLCGDLRRARGPAYRALADAIRVLVGDGRLPAGTRLPAERALAERLRVSRITVTHAYRELRDDGWADALRGSGTWVRLPDGLSHVDGAWVPGPARGGMIDLAHAAPAAPPQMPELVRKAVRRRHRRRGQQDRLGRAAAGVDQGGSRTGRADAAAVGPCPDRAARAGTADRGRGARCARRDPRSADRRAATTPGPAGRRARRGTARVAGGRPERWIGALVRPRCRPVDGADGGGAPVRAHARAGAGVRCRARLRGPVAAALHPSRAGARRGGRTTAPGAGRGRRGPVDTGRAGEPAGLVV
ncbi:winged helix-turn-helix domain-containing protein [Pseudonocardia sp. NPDC049635]|uniref:winged helix-turn-helix domain-containing protein n=1 Tax=Pseudonocardia sp. NPDC049635 TaxID=3155506 RepID=UPI0033F2A447